MTKPITPKQVKKVVPDVVIDCFNALIEHYWDGNGASFSQAQAVKSIKEATGKSSSYIFDNNWLDIESIYDSAGWKVVYDKPGYNEDYQATFTFRKK